MEVVKREVSFTELCNACLSIGRKLHDITDEKSKLFYFGALTEIPLFDMASIPSAICWECKIMLKRAVEFREQVKDSYRILVTCTSENLQDCLLSDVSRPSRFKVSINDVIDIQPTCNFELYDDCDTKISFDDDIDQDMNCDYKSTDKQKNIANSTQSVFVKDERDIKQEGYNSDLNTDENLATDNLDIDKEIKSLLTEVDNKKKIKKMKKGKRDIEKGRMSKRKKCKKVPNSTSKIVTIDLTYEQMTEERLFEYTKESYINAEYKCEDCILGFDYTKSFEAHLAAKHCQDIGDYTCPICKTVLVSVDAFTAHYKRHMRRYECSLCKKRTADFKTMEQHYYTNHEISLKKYKCNECGKISKSIDSHRYHKDSHKTRLQCGQCDKTFRHRGGLLNHRLTVHEMNNAFPCNVCDKTFRWKSSLKRHMETHDDKNKCSSNAAFCVLCNISFGSLSSYQRHMTNSLKHVTKDDFRFICDHCKRRFANKTKLRDHIEEKHLHMTYQCHICLKVSKNRVNLDQHIRNVHKGRPNNKICHHCGKGFPTKVQLESHIRTHTGERPFICEFCPTTFSQQSNLYKHNRQVHLNMKSKRYPISKKRKEEGIATSSIYMENNIAIQYNAVDMDFHI